MGCDLDGTSRSAWVVKALFLFVVVCFCLGQQAGSLALLSARGAAILIRKDMNGMPFLDGIPFMSLSTLSDPRGRYVIATGTLYGTRLALANVYGPNWDDPLFFSNFLAALPDPNNYQLILGGDFNCVLHPLLDRSNQPNSKISKVGAVIWTFMESYALSDPWRRNNPTVKQYSFF